MDNTESTGEDIMTIKKDLEEMGFLTEHINIATKLSTDREEIVNL